MGRRSLWIAALALSVGIGCGGNKTTGSSTGTTGQATATGTAGTTGSSGSHSSSGSSGSHSSSGSSGSHSSSTSGSTTGSVSSGSTGGSGSSGSTGGSGSSGSTGTTLAAPTVDALPPYTNSQSVVVSGTANPGATVAITGGLVATPTTTTADAAGAFSTNVKLNTNVLNTLSVTQSLGGSTSPAATASITEDNVAPSSSFTAPASGSSTKASPIAFSGVCADNLSGVASVTVIINGADAGPATVSNADGGCNFDYAFTAPANSNPTGVAYTVQSVATDRATNVETPGTGTVVTYDTTPPAAPTLTGTTPASPVNATTVTVNATVPCDAASIAVTNANTTVVTTQAIPASSTCSGTQTVAVTNVALQAVVGADTSNSLAATVADAAGNTSTPSAAITVIQDSVTPTLSSVTVDGQAQQDVPQPPGAAQAAFQQVPATPATVVFTFNEPMDAATFSSSANFSLTNNAPDGGAPLAATCSPSTGASTTITCTTTPALVADNVYTLMLTNTGFADTSNPSGGRVLDRSYSYQVYAVQTIALAVASTTPADLARNVAVTNNSITVTFNEQVDSAASQPDGGPAGSASASGNYTIEDCYLANPSTTPEQGCSTIAVSSVAYNAASYTATLTPGASLSGYYHTYKVTVAQAISNLAGTPMAAPHVFLYTNVNRLPGSGLAVVDNGQADGGVVFTPGDGGAVTQVDSAQLAAAEDPDHNPVAFWYDCDNQFLTMSAWDGDATFVNLRLSDRLGTCTNGPNVNTPTGALPPLRRIEVGASPGGSPPAALFDFYLGWARYTFTTIGGGFSVETDTVQSLRVHRPVRWRYASGGIQNVEAPANGNPTRVSLAIDRTLTPPLPVLAVANNAGIHDDICTAEPCIQNTAGGVTDWTVGAAFDTTAQAKRIDSISANVDPSQNLWVSYTSTAVATGNLYLVISPLGLLGTTLASTAMESTGTTDGNVTSRLYAVGGSTSTQIGTAYHDNGNALIRDVGGPSSALPLLPHPVTNPNNPAVAPSLAVYPDLTQTTGDLQVGVVALRRGTNDSTVTIATTTDFTAWNLTDIDASAAPVSGKGGFAKAESGLVVFQGGSNSGKWGVFYLGQDQTQFIGQLYYRQQ
jgi:hypothetical protein